MYTAPVRLLALALGLALLVGVAPVMAAVCQLGCDAAKTETQTPVHGPPGVSASVIPYAVLRI